MTRILWWKHRPSPASPDAAVAVASAKADHQTALARLAQVEQQAATMRAVNTRNHFSESLTRAFQRKAPTI